MTSRGEFAGLELHDAASVGDYDTMEELIQSGKYDLNAQDPEYALRAPIHWAAARGHVDCVRLLLERGADGAVRMDQGRTPAHCAAETGRVHVLKTLHSQGASVLKKDRHGDRPVKMALMYGHQDCVQFLQTVYEERRRLKPAGTPDHSDTETTSET